MNNLEERVYIAKLFDLYGKMLTQKQQELFFLYYYEDLSLSEISIQEAITRQGIHDHLRRAEEKLKLLEEELSFAKRLDNIENALLGLIEQATSYEEIKTGVKELLEEVTYGL